MDICSEVCAPTQNSEHGFEPGHAKLHKSPRHSIQQLARKKEGKGIRIKKMTQKQLDAKHKKQSKAIQSIKLI